MKIAKYVGNLLYDYECVVIPGLGGFITEDKSVSINEVTHNFSPPFRKVHFNIHLRANDGLLVNHVAQQEQIGYKIAKQRVDRFAFQCHNALIAGKKINFKNIGSIYYDSEKNIVFEQDTNANYNPNSFGLGSLISPVIRRVTDEQKIKSAVKTSISTKHKQKKPVDRKASKKSEDNNTNKNKIHIKRRRSSFTKQLIFLLVIIFFIGSGYIYMRRDAMQYYFNKYGSRIPFFYTSVNDYIADNITPSHLAELSRSTASFFPSFYSNDKKSATVKQPDNDALQVSENSDDDNITVEINGEPTIASHSGDIEEINHGNTEEENNAKVAVAKTSANNTVTKPNHSKTKLFAKKYFIIAGSFSNESNANILVKNLKSQGFNALIAGTNKYGMYRVAFMLVKNRPLAESNLLAIRNSNNPKAWLLVK